MKTTTLTVFVADDYKSHTACKLVALTYPFLCILCAPFGKDAMQPFSDELTETHQGFDQGYGDGWFELADY